MKNLKIVAIALIPLTLIAYLFVWDFGVQRYFYTLLSESGYRPKSWTELFKYFIAQVIGLFEIVGPVVYFLTTSQAIKIKIYSLLRYMAVMGLLFSIPSLFWHLTQNHDFDLKILSIYIYYLISIFIAVVLWLVKPEDDVDFVSLADYEMVAYSSAGQRLLNYFVDTVYFSTINFSWLIYYDPEIYNTSSGVWLNLAGTSINFILYYFFAELLFRRTIGKILTNTCVVATHGKMGPARILGRSLARLIPFDVLSFLWNGNWHDKVSGTTVVHAHSWEDIVFEGEEKEAN
ncbi:RDD family protein [Pseudobacter ginsenosidimutans]|uniref:RDD family protein n=1 Tax=Pseudobacter ginsenosidimutans TaxID=661488 RepID=A0A4V2F109_9BACT|nr:RDD family protein [Pseudobacter ginsenosidimutans]QEC41235.1 hypothetical protein FSB84_05840 [Pseudobacter ginsenosidimutans]RZS71991.1 RDD family protein [Pseudobacter ginsenosidimutans]